MAINNETNQIYNDDSNEEDNDEYYLQSTPGAYDIQEKIRAANDELFKDLENYNNISREQRVTFRDELVDYEPSYSSDDGYVHSPDALSVISDEHEEVQEDVPQEIIYTISEENDLEVNEYNELSPNCEILIHKSIGFFDTIEETIEAANIEEVNNSDDNEIIENYEDVEEEIFDEQFIEVVEIINDSFDDEAEESFKKSSDSNTNNSRSSIEKCEKPMKKVKKKLEHDPINCRIHCLEKNDLDLINGKPKKTTELLKGPILKIHKRSCCTNQEVKPKLPIYNGYVSEYGLTKTQLEKRQLRKEKNSQRKKEKCNKIKEEKVQKDLYNEEVFSAWLKSIKNRNQTNSNNNHHKNSNNKEYKVKEVPITPQNKRQRPKTANIYQAYPSISKTENVTYRKRPSTSPCKGYTYNIIFVQNSS